MFMEYYLGIPLVMTQENHIDVTAPVVLGSTSKSQQPLADFVAHLTEHGNVAAAKAESLRLTSYFARMSAILERPMAKLEARQAADEAPGIDPKILRWRKLISRENISGLFNAMAEKTGNTLLSDVIIAPHDVSCIDTSLGQEYIYNDDKMVFGFVQVPHVSSDGITDNTTCAILTLPPEKMTAIAPHGGEKILRDLQAVISLVNHDTLHHLTAPLLVESIAKKLGDHGTALEKWDDKVYDYEKFSQIIHEKMLRTIKNSPQDEAIYRTIDSFFAQLGDAGRALAAADNGSADARRRAHETVDFFGIVMGQALTRAFPLNHPVFAHYCSQMYRADPAPELNNLRHRDAVLAELKLDTQEPEGRRIRQTLSTYKDCGLHILNGRDEVMSYKNHKLLQLITLSPADTAPLAPSCVDLKLAKLQEKSDMLLLKMLRAVAKTTGYKPV